jgi:hypothetical protein
VEIGRGSSPRTLHPGSKPERDEIVIVVPMNNLMTPTTTTTTTTTAATSTSAASPVVRDSEFFGLVADIALGVDAWNRRAVEWARFADRLRSHGAAITIGAPA